MTVSAMPTIAIEGHPEYYEAIVLLASSNHPALRIFGVYGAGDMGADLYQGQPVQTIVYVDKGMRPWTALIMDKKIICRPGWGDPSKGPAKVPRSTNLTNWPNR